MAKRTSKMGLRLVLLAGAGALAALAYRASSEKVIEIQLRREMEKRWGSETAKHVLAAFREHYEELRRDGKQAQGIMKFHLLAARLGLALYRALAKELGEGEDPVDAAHKVIWDAFLKSPTAVIGYMMGKARDPFSSFARVLDRVNSRIFPSAGWKRSRVEVKGGIGFDYTGCFYDDYMREKGAPEITSIFCDMDVRLAECFPPRIEFQRTETLPAGNKRCDFRYYRRG